MTNENALFDDVVTRIFRDRLDLTERVGDDLDVEGAWAALRDAGLTHLALRDDLGGSGGGVLDAARLLRHAGRFAAPLPLAECAFLVAGLLNDAGLPRPGDVVTTPLPHPGDELLLDGRRVSGRLRRVPWGRDADAVVALATSPDGDRVVVLERERVAVLLRENLAGDPCDELAIDGVTLDAAHLGPPDDAARSNLWLRGGLSRALLVAGALEAVATLSVDYARQREQFGRPILAFQAVGQLLVQLVEEAEATLTAVDVATQRYAAVGADAHFEVAAAKIQSANAATKVAALAHQIHGAVGMSQEYALHHLTRRLWTWRQEWGSLSHWSRTLGAQVRHEGSATLWGHLTTGVGHD